MNPVGETLSCHGPGGWIEPRSLYVHVPFCASRCGYCDFFSTPVSRTRPGVQDETVRSTILRAERLSARFGAGTSPGRRYETVYVGGGTPTCLSLPAFRNLMEGIARIVRGDPGEWTVEANPESLDEERLAAMRDAGVTRLSLGMQSPDDGELRTLGRFCDSAAAWRALDRASRSGLDLSVDLLNGIPIPERGAVQVRADHMAGLVDRLVDAGVRHLSVYDLVLEEGTPIAEAFASGRVLLPSADDTADRWKMLVDTLGSRGFMRYEISNFARAGCECLHNEAYWRMDSYVGVGPGAVSTIGTMFHDPVLRGGALRIEEWRDIGRYAGSARELPEGGDIHPGGGDESRIDTADAAFETIMMGFRTARGVDSSAFERRFGRSLESVIGRTLDRWSDRLRAVPSPGIALDDAGMDILNRFLVECLQEFETTLPSFPCDPSGPERSTRSAAARCGGGR